MKKVRYALGAVGAVPAIGLMAPVTTAAVNAPAQKTTAKTVSLRHSSASPAATGCTGSTKATATAMSAKLTFWHTFHPAYDTSCIGTVDTSFFGVVYNASSDRVRIYARSLGGKKHLIHTYWKHHASAHFFSVGVHTSFGYPPIQVCTAAVNTNTSVVEQGPLCKSVG